MSYPTISLSDSQVFTALRSFILSVLPEKDVNNKTILEVVRGQDNRVPEPTVNNFVVMTYLHKERLETNTTKYVSGVTDSTRTDLVPTKYSIRLDVHGNSSADNTQIILSLLRSDYGVSKFKGVGYDVTPLYCDDPIQAPFKNGEQQIEQRWILDVYLQCNPVLTITGIESATTLSVTNSPSLVVTHYGIVDVDNNM